MTGFRLTYLALILIYLFSSPSIAQSQQIEKPLPLSYEQKIKSLPYIKTYRSGLCDTALNFARSAYASNGKYPSNYEVEDQSLKEKNVLISPKNSGWEGFSYDAPVQYKQIEENPHARSYFVVKGENDPNYFVLFHLKGNWRGEIFSLYSLDKLEKVQDILQGYVTDKRATEPLINTFASDSWSPPILLNNPKTKKVEYVDIGMLDTYSPEWKIYQQDNTGKSIEACVISFVPKHYTFPSKNLKSLSNLVHKIIGIPKDPMSEGTLQPTARAHSRSKNLWFNIFLRPWALQNPDTKRQTIENGLNAWSKGHSTYAAQYRQLKILYPLAKKDLAHHYQKTFSFDKETASSLAEKALDNLMRQSFSFSSSQYGG